MELRDRGT